MLSTSETVCRSTFSPTPPLCAQSSRTPLVGPRSAAPLQVPQVLFLFLFFFFCNPVWSRMSRQLSQLPTPDLPAGASPQFGSCTQPAGSLTGGHHSSMSGLKSLLQHPMKGDNRLKAPSDMKGEERGHLVVAVQRPCMFRERARLGPSAVIIPGLRYFQLFSLPP